MAHPKTRARELALQYLYMHDALHGREVQTLDEYMAEQAPPPDAETVGFSRQLVDNVLQHRDELDGEIAQVALNWKINRMAIVDRNILRVGLAELMSCPDTPYRVILNEAVELARRFSSEAACAFVNGLLDKLRAKHRPLEEAAKEPPPAAP
jgi:N utilization substance protein B